MKFESKAHMAQELLSGKRFRTAEAEIFYSEKQLQPFRFRMLNWDHSAPIESSWLNFNKDIWEEVKTPPERHIHQDLIDSYKPGQAWQFKQRQVWQFKQNRGDWKDCIHDKTGVWFQPTWRTDVDYRLHPHNELIQAHRNGAEVQHYTHGDDEYCWVDDPTPCWDTYLEYRIKPKQATLYEWMVRKHGAWHVHSELCTEFEAPSVFSAGYIVEYRKTGRSWEL
jgi:hypothetical protein